MQNDNLCTIYVVRHGETDWNTQQRIQGHTDIPLNTNGELQAKELGEHLKDIHFDGVFSSDLQRAKRTAEIVSLERKLAIKTTELLRERTWGVMEGKSNSELKGLLETLLKTVKEEDLYAFKPFPDVESDEELMARVLTYLREIAVSFPQKTVLVVTHGGVMRELLNLLEPLDKNLRYGIGNAAYVKLESDGVDFFVKEMQGIEVKS